LPKLPRPSFASVLKLGIAAGLALGIRVGGFLIFGYVGLLLLLSALWRSIEARRAGLFLAETWTSGWRVLVPALIVAYPVMLFFWPWAQQAPVEHPLMALATFSHQIFPWKTLFAGEYIPASDLPWEYLPVHILLALPELVLLLLLAAPFLAWHQLRGARWERGRVLGGFLLGFAILFPVGYAIAIKAVLFDGMRHFIFVLPPIICVAALVADWALDRLQRFSVRRLAYGLLALYGVFHVGIMASLHPDEYVYYNGFIGGVHGAQGIFKLDYWANSYAEAVQGLEDYLRAEYGPDFKDHDFTVAVCGPPASAAYYFPSNFIYTPNPVGADFFIAFTKDNCNKSLPGREIYRVTRMDTLLSVVLDRRAVQPMHTGRIAGGN